MKWSNSDFNTRRLMLSNVEIHFLHKSLCRKPWYKLSSETRKKLLEFGYTE